MLKLNFKKAYDMVDWECLMETHKLRGLDQNGEHGLKLGYAMVKHR